MYLITISAVRPGQMRKKCFDVFQLPTCYKDETAAAEVNYEFFFFGKSWVLDACRVDGTWVMVGFVIVVEVMSVMYNFPCEALQWMTILGQLLLDNVIGFVCT